MDGGQFWQEVKKTDLAFSGYVNVNVGMRNLCIIHPLHLRHQQVADAQD